MFNGAYSVCCLCNLSVKPMQFIDIDCFGLSPHYSIIELNGTQMAK